MMLVQHLVQPPEPPNSHSPLSPPTPTPMPTHTLNNTSTSSVLSTSTSTPAPLQLTKTKWQSSKPSTPRQGHPFSTTKTPVTLRPATLAHAPQIAQLGSTTFASSFGFSMPTVDLTTYLHEAYSLKAISADISEAAKSFIVATTGRPEANDDDDVIGFVQLTEGTTDPCLSAYRETEIVELQRLYVHSSAQGLGVGKTLMKEIETIARDKGYRYMWLGVWEGNFIAQRVYESMGFERVGDHEFRMGRCIQTDWIMVKEL